MIARDVVFSITELGAKTGVNPVTLRAWERRYGLLRPKRNDRGYRVYVESDYTRVMSVLEWIEKGVSIGRIKPLLESNQQAYGADREDESLALAQGCLERGDLRGLERVYETWLRSYPQAHIISQKWKPLLQTLRCKIEPGAESAVALLLSFIEQKLQARLLKHLPTKRHPGILLIPVGEDSSLDALFLHVMLTQSGGLPVARLSRSVSASEYPWLASYDLYAAVVFVVSAGMSTTAVMSQLKTALKRIVKPVAIIGEALPSLSGLVTSVDSATLIRSGEVTTVALALTESGWPVDVIKSARRGD
jgi:MerR family transcriptional regulator, light-induced transcriptional regulator